MLKRIIGGLFVLSVLGCAAGAVAGHAYIYILCFVMLVTALLLGLLLLAISLIWKLLPSNIKKTYEGKRGRFDAIVFFAATLFYVNVGLIDRFCLPDVSGFTRLLGYTTAFAFTVFLGSSLIRRSKGRLIVTGTIVFVSFIGLLSFGSFTSVRSGTVAQVDSIEKLKTLGYVDWVPAEKNIDKTGVVHYDPDLAFDGINLYCSTALQEAYLLDMVGNVKHKWAKKAKGADWIHVKMCENGDLLVLAPDQSLMRLDWDSNVKWEKKMRAHHDVCLDTSGRIHVITTERAVVFWHRIPVPILNDCIFVFSPSMEITKRISVYDVVQEQVPFHRIAKVYRALLRVFEPKNMLRFHNYKCGVAEYADILHTNSIEIMDRDIDGFCRKGDWLISVRHADLIGVVDTKKEELVWGWGPGELDLQHHPTLLKNGNVLIFDNGLNRGFSRIIELNPLTKKIVWEYKAEPPEEFFSAGKGSCQRLPNGNTLITESNKGHVFEITKDGRVVWEFYNPEIKMESDKRASMYRMMRITNPGRYTHLRECE